MDLLSVGVLVGVLLFLVFVAVYIGLGRTLMFVPHDFLGRF